MWNRLNSHPSDLVALIDGAIAAAQFEPASNFPDLSSATTLIVASDYAGEHHGAAVRSYSFLVADSEGWRAWNEARRELRERSGLLRRLSFKKLGDRQREDYLPRFLRLAGDLPGALVTFLVNPESRSLFFPSGRPDFDDAEWAGFADWNAPALEKLLRVSTFLGVLLGGLSAPGQNIHWLTDQDPMFASARHRESGLPLASRVASATVGHELGDLRALTTASDTDDLALEDTAAIPDLAGGALVDLYTEFAAIGVPPATQVVTPPPMTLQFKSLRILNWFSDPRLRLRRLVVSINQEQSRVGVCAIRYHGGVL